MAGPLDAPAGQRWTSFRNWTASDLEGIAARFAGHTEAWAGEWMIGPECADRPRQVYAAAVSSVTAQAGTLALPLHAESFLEGDDAPKAWFCFAAPDQFARRDPLVHLAARLVFGHGCRAEKGSVAAELGVAALEKLVASVREIVGFAPYEGNLIDEKRLVAALPDAEFHALAGGVKVALPLADDIALFLNGAAAQKLVPEHAPTSPKTGGLTSVREAAVAGQVGLDVQLNEVELTFGQLKSLQIGDVVVLPHSLQASLRLVTEFDTEIASGFLGRLDDRRAIQVVRDGPDGHKPSA